MDVKQVEQILKDTAYVRTGGSPEELRCAEYLQKKCEELGFQARLESFEVPHYEIQEARLWLNNREIPCRGIFNTGSTQVEAPLYYLGNKDAWSMEQCRGRIVLIDSPMKYWQYQDIVDHGAVGYLVCDGNVTDSDRIVDQKEQRFEVEPERQIPGLCVHMKDAVEMVRAGGGLVRIAIRQTRQQGQSWNVVLDLPGRTQDVILLCAHYDSTFLSLGAYDNMSSCIVLLDMLQAFAGRELRCGLRFVWCGSEERGLLGSKAYCRMHEQELEHVVLNVNLDMLGSVMGRFAGIVAAEDKLTHDLKCFAAEQGFGIDVKSGIRSSDSNSFADAGVPAVSFARYAPSGLSKIHTPTDTAQAVSAEQLLLDARFITAFVERLANAGQWPVSRTIPDKIKEELDVYMLRKRKQ